MTGDYQKAVDLKNTDVLVVLSRMVGSGDGVPVDFDRARKGLEQAIAIGGENAAVAWASLGDLYRNADKPLRDPAKAADAYQHAVDLGDAGSLVKLGRLCGSGDGVPADFRRAKGFFERAVAGGGDSAPTAWASLGDLYRNTDDAHRDPVKAADAYQHAADLGDAGSMIKLARVVGSGDGVPADFDRARQLLEKAVAAGGDTIVDAWLSLGDLYRNADATHRDPGKAADAYRHAADLGNSGAMVKLARLIASGDGVPVNFDDARQTLERAIAVGDENAQLAWASLGDLYRRGEGAQRDPAKAVEAYQKALDLGNTDVLVVLGRMVGNGDGVAADFERAKKDLEQAIALGGESPAWALVTLGDLYRNADPAHRQADKAVDAYQRAIDLGDTASLVKLGRMVGAGDGVSVDFDRARTLLERAIAVGGDGLSGAWASLGDLYRTAEQDHRDGAKAADAYQHAADLGDESSMVRLARLVAAGDGVPVDFDRARTLLEKVVALNGDNAVPAWTSLGDLYRDADQAHRDGAKAVDAYQHAMDRGDSGAMIKLARIVGAGDGVAVDFDRADKALQAAIGLSDDNLATAWASLGNLYRTADAAHRQPAKAVDAYQRAVDLGDTDVLIVLARMVGSGDGVAVDFARAEKLLQASVAAGSGADGWLGLADLYRHADAANRDPQKVVDAYQKAVNLQDARAMVALARMVGSGDGVPVDFDRARQLLESAIGLGGDLTATAWTNLGNLYRNADGALRDPAKAIDAYQHAVDLGDPAAMIMLARMVGSGDGVPVDFPQARGLLEKAVALGGDTLSAAWLDLGTLYRRADAAHRDPALAVEAYQHAVDLGDVGAMISLARMLGNGDGVPVDFRRAHALLEGAVAAGGDSAADAWATLGDLYRNADETHRATAKAVDAYQRAVDLGDSDVMIVLARMVGSGDGVAADFDRAKALLDRAAALGGDNAKGAWTTLGNLYRDAEGGHRDLSVALTYYERAADAGSGEAHLAAAEIESAGKLETDDQRVTLARHYKEAARLLGPEPSARAMYKLDPATLYLVVEEMLSQTGSPIRRIDCVFDRQMQTAINRFCSAKRITSCGKGLVSFDLLMGLLQPEA